MQLTTWESATSMLTTSPVHLFHIKIRPQSLPLITQLSPKKFACLIWG